MGQERWAEGGKEIRPAIQKTRAELLGRTFGNDGRMGLIFGEGAPCP